MKSLLILIGSAALSLNVIAQNKSSISITTPEAKMVYKPATILYTGMDNLLKIESSDLAVKRISIEVDNADIRREITDYIVIVKNVGDVVLRFYDDTDRMNRKLLESRTLKAINPPEMKVMMAGKSGGIISREELMKVETLEVLCPSCNENIPEVAECKVSIAGKGVSYKEYSVRGNILPDEVKEAFKNMTGDAKIYVEYIKVKPSSDSPLTRQMSPLTFVVSN
jgi:hypothetical protein